MYPQFADSQSVRGLPDMGRNAARFPYPQYYGSKMAEGLSSYPPGMGRPGLNPYAGKPSHDPLYGGHMSWNSMMAPPGMVPPQMQKPIMTNKPEYSFPGQDQMYRAAYHPEMMNNAGAPGGYPGYMYPVGAYQHPSSYLPPPSMPPPPPHHHHQMDGYGIPPPPHPPPHQTNSVWDGSSSVSSANMNSPGRSWSGSHQEIMSDSLHPPPGYQSSQSPQPPVGGANNELQKGSSVSSLKDALANPPPPQQQSLHDSSLSSTNKSFQFNTPSYLSVGGDTVSHASPRTPNAVGTPDPATPSIPGIIPNNEPSSSPLQPPQQQNDLGSHGNGTSRPTSNSPFEVEAILGFNKDTGNSGGGGAGGGASTENGEPFPFTKSPHHKSISPPSSTSSPAVTKKTRTPSFSTVARTHPSLANQYNMSDEPGRRDFLDAIFKYMEQENIPFLKPPSISKCVLDLYKTFTAVQRLGGFTHVVDKKLWKEVLKSFCTSNNPSSASMRTLSEYYVNVLLPYECHFSHTNFSDCMSRYELSHRPQSSHPPPPPPPPPVTTNPSSVVSNNNDSSDTVPPPTTTATAPSNEEGKEEVDSNKQQDSDEQQLDNLLDGNSRDNLIFSEDSLPDISVQEAESVLGISTSSSGPQPATPSPSFPPGWSSPGGGGTGEQPPSMGESPMGPSPYQQPGLVHPHHSGGFPGYYPGGGAMPDYSSHYQRKSMSPYMGRAAYPGYHDDGSYNYPNLMMHHRMDDYGQHGMGGMGEWPWPHPSMQQRPHLPPPLPPHLQSMMFTPPHPPPLSLSPRPSTPHQQQTHMQHHQSSAPPPSGVGGATSESGSSSPIPMDPIKIMITDQGAPSQAPPPSASVGDKVATTPPHSHKPVDKDLKASLHSGSVKDEKPSPVQQQQFPKRPVEPVETIQPQLIKRRRLNCDHCGNVQPWHVMMSLKCGLPAESTWALDTLTILLHDDRTVGFFYLKHHHSLLNTLVNHFNTCLYQIFGSPFQLLDKFDSSTASTDSKSPTASIYHHSCNDVRMGLADHVCHFVQSTPIVDALSESLPESHPLVKLEAEEKMCQRVDETRVDELLKRDALTERVLLHLKTPRRLMARSPIQKYFLPHQPEEGAGEMAEPSSPLREENEVLKCEPLPLCLIPSQQEAIKQRTLSLSNILRSLSFIPGNDIEFSQHPGLLAILGHLILLHHVHLHSSTSSLRHSKEGEEEEEEEEEERSNIDEVSTPTITEEYWWWSCLDVLRENVFVILANIGGQLDFSLYPEAIAYPLITGLLHWLVCPSSVATDPLPDSAMVYALSPQRLVVEALAKISISEANVDFILATPPLTRLDLVYSTLLQFVGQKKYPAVRQFALVLLSDLAQGSEGASRMIGQQKMTLPLLLECIESSLTVSKTRYMSTQYMDDANSLSLAMLRRAAVTLHCIAKVTVNRISFLPYCNRVLALSMSDALDPSLSSILSDVLYELTRLL